MQNNNITRVPWSAQSRPQCSNPFNVSLCNSYSYLTAYSHANPLPIFRQNTNSFSCYANVDLTWPCLGPKSRLTSQVLQRFTANNPPDIGRLVDAFTGMHEIFYKDKSKQDSHRTNVTSGTKLYRYVSNAPKPHRFGCEAKDKWNFKSYKTFLFAHVKYWPMKPKFYNHWGFHRKYLLETFRSIKLFLCWLWRALFYGYNNGPTFLACNRNNSDNTAAGVGER